MRFSSTFFVFYYYFFYYNQLKFLVLIICLLTIFYYKRHLFQYYIFFCLCLWISLDITCLSLSHFSGVSFLSNFWKYRNSRFDSKIDAFSNNAHCILRALRMLSATYSPLPTSLILENPSGVQDLEAKMIRSFLRVSYHPLFFVKRFHLLVSFANFINC